MATEALLIAEIRTDGGTQPRVELDQAVIAEYTEALRDGAHFPPVVVFYDGSEYWLADGFHRLHAAARVAWPRIEAEVRMGDRRAAVLYAVGANAAHGLRRTHADKRRAVLTVLSDPEWARWPQHEIARRCAVSREYVNRLSRELNASCARSQDKARTVRRGAGAYVMDTSRIGGSARAESAQPGRTWRVNEAGGAQAEPTETADPTEPGLGETLASRSENLGAERTEAGARDLAPDMPSGEPSGARDNAVPRNPWAVAEPAEPIERDAEVSADASDLVGPVTIRCGDARRLDAFLAPASVHLAVTSPPYNVGVGYSEHNDTLPPAEYAGLLADAFQQCHTVMVAGARIAVVVPYGVGRNPWVPVAGPVMTLLERAGFTLRGQITWHKGACGNRTSWGSFRLPTDPSLRDTTEVILVAHKGPGRLAVPGEVIERDGKGSFSPWLASADDFMALAQDYWPLAPESAARIGHPAPFPVALAERLIRFYAYPRAHVLDPFAGSGTVGVAALRLGCRATLVDIDASYCELARRRCERELSSR